MGSMKITARLFWFLTAVCLLVATLAWAEPKRNIGSERHPNLAKAQRLGQQAWESLVEAQRANEWDLGGHAQKAKEHLDNANREIKIAAEAANRR